MATHDTTVGAQPAPIRLRAEGRRWGEVVVKGVLALCALVSVATTVGIVIALLQPSIEFFREVSIVDFFSGDRWAPALRARLVRRPAAPRRHARGHVLGLPRRACPSGSARPST